MDRFTLLLNSSLWGPDSLGGMWHQLYIRLRYASKTYAAYLAINIPDTENRKVKFWSLSSDNLIIQPHKMYLHYFVQNYLSNVKYYDF